MADQEFLASFAVDIDEAGVSRLQAVLDENREYAERLAGAFGAAAEAVRALAEETGALPELSAGSGMTAERPASFGSLTPGLDLTLAESQLKAFTALAKKPIALTANASGMVSAARAAYNSIKSLFSTPIPVKAKVEKEGDTGEDGDSGGSALPGMSSGGRFSRPAEVQVAEDGDAEYIIPVKKEDRALPLLRRLLSELSPAARESLAGGAEETALPAGLAAESAAPGGAPRETRILSAPVNIRVEAAGTDPEAIGKSVYDTAERYLLRTLRSAFD